jgi:hypothetical protein
MYILVAPILRTAYGFVISRMGDSRRISDLMASPISSRETRSQCPDAKPDPGADGRPYSGSRHLERIGEVAAADRVEEGK